MDKWFETQPEQKEEKLKARDDEIHRLGEIIRFFKRRQFGSSSEVVSSLQIGLGIFNESEEDKIVGCFTNRSVQEFNKAQRKYDLVELQGYKEPLPWLMDNEKVIVIITTIFHRQDAYKQITNLRY